MREVRAADHPGGVRHHRLLEALPPRSAASEDCVGSTPASTKFCSARPGGGKTHTVQALSHLAIRQGAHVRFAKTSPILAELAGDHADRTRERRIQELVRPDVLIFDDFAVRQLSAAHADDLYELVSERQGHS
ncbi:ATP-binding protein [Streptomyces sp. NPDC053069]|uniref:ATP-binding protein n=1 Tax=Streptomyces sp. NPDC053069 TaxID=3365695 RepID=UPI0037CD449D